MESPVRVFRAARELARYAPFALLPLFALKKVEAQVPFFAQGAYPRFAILTPEARNILAADWDKHLNDHPYLERAYCGHWVVGSFADEPAYIVNRITPPDSLREATNNSIRFQCLGSNVIPIHVHPPRDCEHPDGKCEDDGLYAYQCMASDSDRRYLVYFGFPFGMVQCDRKAVVSFWTYGV